MECLICYRVEVNFEAEKYKKSATTFCHVFGLPATSEEPFYSSTVCDLCLQRLADLEVMLREIQQIQENVSKVKSEMEKDLLNSQRLSEEESKISELRVRIINDITSRDTSVSLEDPEDISTHFLVAQPSASSLVQVKLEEGGSQPHQIEDSDHFQLDFSPPSPANESSEPLLDFLNDEKPMKNAIILLEKLPVLVGGSSIIVNQEPIKSYTLRNPPLRSNASNFQMEQNIQKKRARRKRKRLFPKKIKAKPKPPAPRMTQDEYEEYKKAKELSRTCTICDKVFNRRVKYLVHMNRVHGEGEPTFLCQECGKAFFTKDVLKGHLILHGIGKDLVTCPLCEKPFPNQAKCDHHMAVIHQKQKPFACSFCDLKFSYEHKLKAHWNMVHLGEKIFCNEPECGKEFKNNYTLRMHINRFHRNREELKFSCSECDKKYAINAELTLHIRSAHLKEKNCLCELCPARYFSRTLLRRHVIAAHTEIRPFKCKFCPKAFKDKANLDRHHSLHSSEKPFVCQYCGEAYQVGSSLKTHIKFHHSERRGEHLIADPNKRRKLGRRTKVQIVTDANLKTLDQMNLSSS